MPPVAVSTTHCSFPPIEGPEKYLFKGRYLGRELRLICDDSTGLFPRSAKSKPGYYDRSGRAVRYTSEYVRNYTERGGVRPSSEDTGLSKYGDRPDVIGARRPWTEPVKLPSHTQKELTAFQRGTIARKGHINHPSQWQMFNTWKVPTRVIEGQHKASPRKEKSPRQEKPLVPEKCESPRLKKAASPPAQKSPRKSPVVEKSSRKSPPQMTRRSTSTDEDAIIRKARNDAYKERADSLLKNADSCQRRRIEKTYREAERGELEQEFVQKRTKIENTRKLLDNWLETATDDEKTAAQAFFKILQKKNEEQGNPNGGVKVDDVLRMLDDMRIDKPKNAMRKTFPTLSNNKGGEPKTKYIRLYTPGTRKDRDLHQTWHHMPPIKEKKYHCLDSHFIDAQAPQHRHFTIHPDWGP